MGVLKKASQSTGGGGDTSSSIPTTIPMRTDAANPFYLMNVIPEKNSMLTRGTYGKTSFWLVPIEAGTHISRVGVSVSTAYAGSKAQFGIYTVGDDGYPDALVEQVALPDPITTGDKESVVDWTIEEGGWYYFALDATSGASFYAFDDPTHLAHMMGSWNSTNFATNYRPNSVLSGGIFPDNVDISASSGLERADIPSVYFKDIP